MSGKFCRNRPNTLAAALLAAMVLSGCATNGGEPTLSSSELLHPEAFQGYENVHVEPRTEVFGLDESAKQYLDAEVRSVRDFHARGRALLDAIFQQARLNFSYDSKANTTATQTFHNRAANCLSLSILTYAMADYAGFDATFQEVDIPEYWERRKNFSLMNTHINLRLSPKPTSGTMLIARDVNLQIDFQPSAVLYPTRGISQNRALGMFYNNKGVDALLAGDQTRAYAYFNAALRQDPSLGIAVTNLGLLYANNGHPEWAETNYQHAIALDPENIVASEGLAVLMRRAGRVAEADAIMARFERARESNPYYHYIRGAEAYDDGDIEASIRFYKRALSLQPDTDQFHFDLARSYLALGNTGRADFHLRRAEHNAAFEDLKKKYRDMRIALSQNSR